PEMVRYLRELSGTHKNKEISAILNVSYFAVTSKQRELRLLDSGFADVEPDHLYARWYVVSRAAVRSVGVESLERMDEITRRRTLWRIQRSQSSTTEDRADRMLELSARIAQLR